MKIKIKVVPEASRNKLAGWLGESIKVCVCEPAEKGKANKAVRKVIGKALKLPLAQITIVAGSTTPRKTIEIKGLSEKDLHRKLADLGIAKK